MDGVQLPWGYSHFREAVYFLPISQGINQTLYRRLTTPSQLKLAEHFPNWVFPKLLNPIKLKK